MNPVSDVITSPGTTRCFPSVAENKESVNCFRTVGNLISTAMLVPCLYVVSVALFDYVSGIVAGTVVMSIPALFCEPEPLAQLTNKNRLFQLPNGSSSQFQIFFKPKLVVVCAIGICAHI